MLCPQYWWPDMAHSAGERRPPPPRTMQLFSSQWRGWRTTPEPWPRRLHRSPAHFTTNIFCASTDKTPTTARLKRNDSCPRIAGCIYAGPPCTGGFCDHRLLFPAGSGDWTVFEGAGQPRRGLLHGRTRDDGLGGGPGVLVGEPRIARTDGLGRQCL